MAGPADLHCAESLAELDGEGLGRDLVGDKLRARKEIEQDVAEEEGGYGADLAVIVLRRICQLTAYDLGRVEPEPAHDEGVEALDTVVAGVLAQHGVGLFAQLPVALAVFELDDERAAASDGLEHLGEQRYSLVGSAKAKLSELVKRLGVDACVHAADAV